MNQSSSKERGSSPYEAALEAAFNDLAEAQTSAERNRDQMERDLARVMGLKQAIQNLIDLLPSDRRVTYFQRMNDVCERSEAPTRGGPVFDNVISLFKRMPRREWTAADVQRELSVEGLSADAKAVNNVLGYLARTRRITRIARGHYLVLGGGGLVTDQEIEGAEYGQSRLTEHDF